MEQNKTDLVMKFVLDGNPVPAESNLDVAPGDPLMTDFSTGTDYDFYSNFFEATSFEMGMSLKEDDESSSLLNPNARLGAHPVKVATPVGQYSRWRSATQDEYKKVPFRLEFDKFSFKRVIDSASPIFFEACCMSRTFDSAVLVKRIAQGDQSEGNAPSIGYLRVDFSKVLIIGVNWDDGDVVMEQCEFICQGLTIAYRQQQQNGIFGATMTANWSKDLALKSRGGRGH
jgi:type VI protein secretion system component Hcp